MLRYEIDISIKRTFVPAFLIHTKSKYQFQECQIVEYEGHLAIWNSMFNMDSNRFSTEGLCGTVTEKYIFSAQSNT